MRIKVRFCVAGLLGLAFFGCGDGAVDSVASGVYGRVQAGGPIAGLTDAQLALFFEGEAAFVRELDAADGLGPVFTERSCVACHGQGGIGGADPLVDPNHFVERYARLDASGGYDKMSAFGGDVRQTRSIAGEVQGCNVQGESVPAEATIHSFHNPLPMFGIGLIAAIPAATILAGAVDKGDGIHGRPNLDGAGLPGRFGWKAQSNDLAPFNAGAANGTMGFTSSFSPSEQLPQGQPIPAGCTNADVGASSPNDVGDAAILAITAWEVMLAPVEPKRRVVGVLRQGERLFHDVGCAKCHTPSMQTGPFDLPLAGGGSMPIAAVSNKTANLYSDLLLHDMGPGLDEQVTMRQAGGSDFRTTPLWGIRLRTRFLHDGRAHTVDQAIRAHGGEADVVVGRYHSLSRIKRWKLRRFVKNL